MNEPYDSTADTIEHIVKVGAHICGVIKVLKDRINDHDASKLVSPEKEVFDVVTPKLKALTYGSDEYKGQLRVMGTALNHHYQENRHHPEHWERGVDHMTLVDLVEMLCDWAAATERHEDGDIMKSLEINGKRFQMTEQLASILKNTVREYKLGKGI